MIGGLQACSFIDYAGMISAVFFTRGCNLRCRYCHNPQLCSSSGEPALSKEAFVEFLEKRRGKLAGAVFSGGEPTLHDSLPEYLYIARSMGFSIKLDTNGTRPETVRRMTAENLIDYAAVDVKSPAGEASLWLCGMENQADPAIETLRCLIDAKIPCEARTTAVDGIHNPETLDHLARRLHAARVGTWRLQPVEPGAVLDPSVPLHPPAPELLSRAVDFAASLGMDASVRPAPRHKQYLINRA